VRWYNLVHRHSGIKFVTPQERHTGADIEILKQREVLYATARAKKPERWSGKARDWSRPVVVMLNPDKKTDESGNKLEKIA
jgi:putative transposase